MSGAAVEIAAPLAAASPETRTRLPVAAALLAVYVIWGSTYLAMRIGLETIPPFLMAGARFVVAGSILYATLRVRGAPAPTWTQWVAAAKIGGLMLVAGNGFVALAEQRVSSSVAAMVIATTPLWMALISTLGGQRPTRLEWVGLSLGFAGVALLQAGGQLDASPGMVAGLLLAPACWALGSAWSRRLPLPSGAMASAAEMLCGGVAMLGVSVARGEHLLHAPSLRSVGAVVYLIAFGSIIGFSAYGYLLRTTRPAVATSYAYVNPVVALGLGILLGGERAGGLTWVAAAITLAGVVLLSLGRARAPAPKR